MLDPYPKLSAIAGHTCQRVRPESLCQPQLRVQHLLLTWLTGVAWLTAAGLGVVGQSLYATEVTAAAVGASPASTPNSAPLIDAITVLPKEVVLRPPLASQQLIVERLRNDEAAGPVAGEIVWTSSDPSVAEVREGRVVGLANGTAVMSAVVEGHSLSLPVTVTGFGEGLGWSFRNHVQSVLTKASCNMGACHGATAGKNGFRLSLRGYDPESDFFQISRQARGRRVVPDDPGRSLILTKPTGLIPHQGGLRFREDSLEYRVVADWIAQGSVGPDRNDPRITRLEVLPAQVSLKPGDRQPLVVQATFSNGAVEDVTRWAKFSSTNHSVATVDDQGHVTVTGSGEASIVAWYLAQNVTGTVTVPYLHEVAESQWAQSPRVNFIDELVLQKLARLRIPVSPRSQDEEFLRRVYLDTIGVLPTVSETSSFLADTDPGRRSRLIDDLLARPEYVDYWAYKWSDLLLVTGSRLRPDAVKSYAKWIRECVAADLPWDQLARQIVLAAGSNIEQGPANFYTLHQDPLDLSETVSMAFLGMAINCARCHDHPLEKWTNDDYYGMVSLFGRVRAKGWGGDFRSGDGNRMVFLANEGEVIQPRLGRPQPPKPLDAPAIDFATDGDRRAYLADWLTAAENPYFSKAIVNRVWANFFGIGLVEAVDDLRLTNPPSHPELLEALATHLVEQGYDLKSLMRLILNSETYQRSSDVVPGNEVDQRFYARCYPRRLSAEVLLDAFSAALLSPTAFPDQPVGTRAMQLPDASITSYFLDTFGRPERVLTCECQRTEEPSMTQVLHITNGKTLLEKLEAADNRVGQLMASGKSDQEILSELYLAALCRRPSPQEELPLLETLANTPAADRRQLWEDIAWSVLSSREFLFQH